MEHVILFLFLSCVAVCLGCGCPDEWVSYQGSCYLFNDTASANFTDAELYCVQQAGHLVVIETSGENDFLRKFLKRLNADRYWMGLSDEKTEGTWQWSSRGIPLTYTNWGPGQPNSLGNEDCAIFWRGHAFHWDDVSCLMPGINPLCEKSMVPDVVVG